MTIRPEEIEGIARLAALEVSAEALPELAAELTAIVGYVGQLSELETSPGEERAVGPSAAPLRADRVVPAELSRDPAALAPEFRDGFFLVPRIEAGADVDG